MPDLREMDLSRRDMASVLAASVPQLARPHLIRGIPGSINTCLFSTHVALDILRGFDLHAEEMPTRVVVGNSAYRERMSREGRPPLDQAELNRWIEEDGAWCMGCGHNPRVRPGHYNGHLVAIAESEFMLDLSADQFERPQFGLEVDVIGGRVSTAFVDGLERNVMVNSHGAVLIYERHDDVSYKTAPDWTNPEAIRVAKALADALILEITALEELPIPVGGSA